MQLDIAHIYMIRRYRHDTSPVSVCSEVPLTDTFVVFAVLKTLPRIAHL